MLEVIKVIGIMMCSIGSIWLFILMLLYGDVFDILFGAYLSFPFEHWDKSKIPLGIFLLGGLLILVSWGLSVVIKLI